MYETGNSDKFCHNCWDSTVVRDYNIRYTDNTRSHTQRYRNCWNKNPLSSIN